MNFYPHHIGDFNNATRHLTRVERALYRDLIELYYDTEQPLPAGDIRAVARRVLAFDDAEIAIVQAILTEFFTLDGDVYRHSRCDAEIEKYRGNIANKKRAGQASAAMRNNRSATPVEQTLNTRATNQEPRTNNQEPIKEKTTRRKASLPVPVDWKPKQETLERARQEFGLIGPQLEAYRIAFVDICEAKGYTYANIDAAWMNCIRKDWPGLRSKTGNVVTVDLAAQKARNEIERTRQMLDQKLGPQLRAMP